MQRFKGDPIEIKMETCGKEILQQLGIQLDLFYTDAYEASSLGDIIYDDDRSPLSKAMARNIFRTSFAEIFNAFVFSGTFESYLTVFTKIFGDDVDVQFTVPGPGKLQIDIIATDIELNDFIVRNINDNQYFFDTVITQDEADTIVFQTIKGFQSQYELEQMLFELVPGGVYTEITLTF